MTTLTQELSGWAAGLRLDDVPPRVLAIARSLVLSQLAAARATLGHELGRKIVRGFGPPVQDDPKRTAYVLAALTMALDFDDTIYAGHVTHGAVNVPLAYARALGRGGADMLVAAIAAIEGAARVTAAATLGPFRGQTAGHAHLVAAVLGRLHVERAPREVWADALGLALAAPPWPLLHAFVGSDAKLFTAATPVRTALDACDAAAVGLSGAAGVIEHPDGFLAAFATVPLPEAAVAGLGTRWHTETASLKVHPGSAYVNGCVDCAIELQRQRPGLKPGDVAEVVVETSLFAAGLERRFAAYASGGALSRVALNFSVGYSVATALLTGALVPADFDAGRARDERRWALAAKVRVEEDRGMTLRALSATAPLGEALRQAGERAVPWLRAEGGEAAAALAGRLGAPVASFEHATKAMPARVTLRLASGRELVAERDAAIGAAGDPSRERHFELMREKFLATGGPLSVVDAIARLEELDAAELDAALLAALGG